MNPIEDRYLEDYVVGSVHEVGTISVTEKEVIDFAKRFDPQTFHMDPQGAKKTRFGGIIASGWHTCALVMRLLVDNYLSKVANITSPGVDEIRWIKPVRPGEELSIRATVLAIRPFRSRPESGLMTYSVEVINQGREVVMTMKAMGIMLRRGCKQEFKT